MFNIYVITFFSILGFIKSREKIIKICIGFISGVFFAYFAIGIFLYSTISNINFYYFNQIIKILIVILCATLFILNIIDSINAKKGQFGKILLQLPKRVRELNGDLIKSVVQIESKSMYLFYFLIFILGLGISFTEFLCTGQIYLPVILSVVQMHKKLDFLGIIYFIIYDLSFITPLTIVSIGVLKSNSVMRMSNKFMERMYIIKLVNAIFFLVFGIIFFIYQFL